VIVTRIVAQTPSLKNPYKMYALLLASSVANRRSQHTIMFAGESLYALLFPVVQIFSSEFLW
jgi:hypothetical protein